MNRILRQAQDDQIVIPNLVRDLIVYNNVIENCRVRFSNPYTGSGIVGDNIIEESSRTEIDTR